MRHILQLSLLAALILLAGCAETPQEKADRLEPMLAAAGFRMVPVDTPRKQAIFSSLTPLKLTYHFNKEGQPVYWFADPYDCNCLYLGDSKAYQQFQQMKFQAHLADEERQAAELNQDAAMQMGVFGPFWW
ncbi:MAG TPA: hypothetical protein VFB15_00630 [Candidatus Binataceae bacterium]|jgi:hypothetical protein|nr:hypothetical protein [Candidatus Binataceae bacterium]